MNKLLQKYNSITVQAKAAFWFTMCSFLQKGISFVTVPIFTRLMSTEQYGTYSMYLSWLQVFTVISTLYIYHGVTDNAMSKFDNDRDRYISSMQGLTVCITTIVMMLTFIFWHGIHDFVGLSYIMMLLMFLEIYVTPALAFWSSKQRFEYKYRRLVIITLVKSILNPCLGIAAVCLSDEKDLARVISTVTVEFIVCGAIMALQFIRGKVFYDKRYWGYSLRLAVPIVPHYLSGIILNQGDRIVISKIVGNSAVAFYGVAYSIGWIVQIFVRAINSAITPWIYERLKESDIRPIQRRSGSILLLVFLMIIGLMLISPEVVLIFGSSKYADAVYVIPPVAGSVFFVFLYGFLSFPEFYYEKTGFLMMASIAAAVVNIVLNVIFIPLYGYVAAAYTTLACYVLYSLGHYIVGGKILKDNTGFKAIIDVKITLVLSVAIIIISCTVHLFFDWIVLRYLIILIGAAAAFIKRKKIVELIINK